MILTVTAVNFIWQKDVFKLSELYNSMLICPDFWKNFIIIFPQIILGDLLSFRGFRRSRLKNLLMFFGVIWRSQILRRKVQAEVLQVPDHSWNFWTFEHPSWMIVHFICAMNKEQKWEGFFVLLCFVFYTFTSCEWVTVTVTKSQSQCYKFQRKYGKTYSVRTCNPTWGVILTQQITLCSTSTLNAKIIG